MSYSEANITINGKQLSVGESMTLRVAISSFLSDIQDNGLGTDDMGKSIAEGYKQNSLEILQKMGVI